MHKVILKGNEAASVKCPACKQGQQIQANRHTHPVTMAFTHTKQAIKGKCANCAKDFSWSPEELVTAAMVPVAPAPVSFHAKDLMSAHFEGESLDPAMA